MTQDRDQLLMQSRDGWIELHSGGRFPFKSFTKGDIHIQDLAHALAHVCRYNGHVQKFYSVAEHSVVMMLWAERNLKDITPVELMTILLHDASEAYIGDMTRPLKQMFPEFKALEERIHMAVAERFGTMYPHPEWLKDLNLRILVDERKQAMGKTENDWGMTSLEGLNVYLSFWSPAEARDQFRKQYERLCAMRSAQPVEAVGP